MIKIENIVLTSPEQWKAVIRGMRNPMNSWDKSDSYSTHVENPETGNTGGFEFFIGENDMKLMKTLVNAGSDDRKFLRMIPVWMDVTAPLYWWSEYDTYKVGTVANSCSKMHKLLHKPFEMSDFSFDHIPGYKNEVTQFRPILTEEMIANEIWVWIDNEYDVSQYGRVKHKFKNHYRLISGSLHEDGYIFVTLHEKQIPVHRLVAKYFISNPDELPEVNHKDGNKQNNCVDNLEWVTRSENMKHAHQNNLQAKGLTTYTGKFTPEQREAIKRKWDCGILSKRKLAIKYGVSHTCINDIINDKYKYAEKTNVFEEVCRPLIDTLNELRDSYLACENEDDKKVIWYTILELLPESYNQKRTVFLNFEVLLNMYHARKNHKLDEWRVFCKVIEEIPYFKEICLNNNDFVFEDLEK